MANKQIRIGSFCSTLTSKGWYYRLGNQTTTSQRLFICSLYIYVKLRHWHERGGLWIVYVVVRCHNSSPSLSLYLPPSPRPLVSSFDTSPSCFVVVVHAAYGVECREKNDNPFSSLPLLFSIGDRLECLENYEGSKTSTHKKKNHLSGQFS